MRSFYNQRREFDVPKGRALPSVNAIPVQELEKELRLSAPEDFLFSVIGFDGHLGVREASRRPNTRKSNRRHGFQFQFNEGGSRTSYCPTD